MTQRFGFRVVSVHLGLVTSDYGVHEVGALFVESNMSCKSWVYGYDPETKSFRHFTYNENPTRALNTTLPKCCLPLTDVRKTSYRRKFSWNQNCKPRDSVNFTFGDQILPPEEINCRQQGVNSGPSCCNKTPTSLNWNRVMQPNLLFSPVLNSINKWESI